MTRFYRCTMCAAWAAKPHDRHLRRHRLPPTSRSYREGGRQCALHHNDSPRLQTRRVVFGVGPLCMIHHSLMGQSN